MFRCIKQLPECGASQADERIQQSLRKASSALSPEVPLPDPNKESFRINPCCPPLCLKVQSDLANPAVNVGPGDVLNLSGHQTVNAIVYPHLVISQQSISWILPIMVYRSVAGIQAVLCEWPDKKTGCQQFFLWSTTQLTLSRWSGSMINMLGFLWALMTVLEDWIGNQPDGIIFRPFLSILYECFTCVCILRSNLTAAFIPHAGAPTCITASRQPPSSEKICQTCQYSSHWNEPEMCLCLCLS